MLQLFIILALIHIENNCADFMGSLFQKNKNATRWKMCQVIHESSFQKCALWCSQSGRCQSFSVDEALLTCHLHSNDSVDTQPSMTEPKFAAHAVWEKVMSFKNKPGSPKEEMENARLPCVTGLQNVALKKSTEQSTPYDNGESYKAVDGTRDTNWLSHSCSHTADDARSKEWWYVDLETVYDIQDIKIWNRGDCCSERLSDFTVYVGNQSLGDRTINYKKCLYHHGSFEGMKSLSCSQWSRGQFVKIELSNGQPLALCEVEVYPRLCDTD